MATKHSLQRGLSLIEVLISIAILAGIAITFAPIIHTAATASKRVHETSAQREKFNTSSRLIRHLLTSTITYERNDSADGFTGSQLKMAFNTIGPTTGAPVRGELSINPANDSLLLTFYPIDGEMTVHQLMTGVRGATFSYFGDTDDAGSRSWRSQWINAEPPDLIRLTGAHSSDKAQAHFSFEVAPAGHAILNCRFDAVSRTCRN